MQFIRKKATAKRVGYHPSHIMRLVRANRFPQPVRIGPNSIAFVEEEVNQWQQARVDARDADKDRANQDAKPEAS